MADFTLMFVPNEWALAEALRAEPGLWDEAFALGVALVSPVSLMAVLRVVRLAWTKEAQSKNREAIVKAGSELLDRVRDYFDAMEAVGRGLETAREAYRRGMGLLHGGRGVRSIPAAAERLERLGVDEARVASKRARSFKEMMEEDAGMEVPETPDNLESAENA